MRNLLIILFAASCVTLAPFTVATAKETSATAKKSDTSTKSSKSKTSRSKKSKAAAVVAPMVLPEASAEQVEAAKLAFLGTYECELNQTLDVKNHEKPGYIDVRFANKSYAMRPVVSSTGALRLEDMTGRTLMLQIANKSMLMDVKAGNRLVDGCIHEKQKDYKASPETSIGIQ
jgi:hypothetical protein